MVFALHGAGYGACGCGSGAGDRIPDPDRAVLAAGGQARCSGGRSATAYTVPVWRVRL